MPKVWRIADKAEDSETNNHHGEVVVIEVETGRSVDAEKYRKFLEENNGKIPTVRSSYETAFKQQIREIECRKRRKKGKKTPIEIMVYRHKTD